MFDDLEMTEECDGTLCGERIAKGTIEGDAFSMDTTVEWVIERWDEIEDTICRLPCAESDGVVINNPDHVILTYKWTAADGRDLDSATTVTGSGIAALNGEFVGWWMDADTPIGHNKPTVTPYTEWGGDNIQSGAETVYIKLNKFREVYNTLPSTFTVELYARWYESQTPSDTGNADISVAAYKGGCVSKKANQPTVFEHHCQNSQSCVVTDPCPESGGTILEDVPVRVRVTQSGHSPEKEYRTPSVNYSHIGYVQFKKTGDPTDKQFTITIGAYQNN